MQSKQIYCSILGTNVGGKNIPLNLSQIMMKPREKCFKSPKHVIIEFDLSTYKY